MRPTKFYCERCDRIRAKAHGELCPSCQREDEAKAAVNCFEPKFANVYSKPNCDAVAFMQSWLDGNDYERGSLETAQVTANNVADAFARMIGVFFENGTLTKEDVEKIAGAF